MKISLEDIDGEIVKKTEQYTLIDNRYLKNLVFSKTLLNIDKSTSGHKHDDLDEVYIFLKGLGEIDIDSKIYPATPGDTFLIKGGQFHKVHNRGAQTLEFVCIFQSYIRK